VVVPSRYKLGLVLLLLVSSCTEEPSVSIESHGLELDTSDIFIDAIAVDSMSFASGKKQWLLKGLIVSGGMEYPYSMVFENNPFASESKPTISTPPKCIDSNEEVQVLLTRKDRNVMISWKTKNQFLCVKSVFTSGH